MAQRTIFLDETDVPRVAVTQDSAGLLSLARNKAFYTNRITVANQPNETFPRRFVGHSSRYIDMSAARGFAVAGWTNATDASKFAAVGEEVTIDNGSLTTKTYDGTRTVDGVVYKYLNTDMHMAITIEGQRLATSFPMDKQIAVQLLFTGNKLYVSEEHHNVFYAKVDKVWINYNGAGSGEAVSVPYGKVRLDLGLLG